MSLLTLVLNAHAQVDRPQWALYKVPCSLSKVDTNLAQEIAW